LLRIKVGSFIPDHPETFEADLLAWLNSQGKLSEVEGRGLEVIPMRHKSEPGSHPMKIAAALNMARSPLSTRKLLNRLTDMNERELHRALMKMVRAGEVKAEPRTLNRYKYFLYSLTELGVEEWEKRTEAYESGKPWALEIWRVFKAHGWKRGQRVDPREVLAEFKAWETTPGSVEDKEFWAGWRTLVAAGRITTAYNADGPGKHQHFIA
jgi:hypothetical protein